tara:strand:+ start:13253 stop:14149 length:897 start_codon:yes stop_codon:yes gene_type:complete
MNSAEMQKAIALLNSAQVVGMPTETVYGLAARIDLAEAISKIFTTKQRPDFDPLIVHVSSIDQAKECTSHWSEAAQKLAEAFWPGPLTLILPKATHISGKITSGLTSVGIRCPDHPLALELIRATGPLAAPSANRFGKTSPTTKGHVDSEFEGSVFTLEGGSCQVGIESTVVGVFDDRLEIYRPGSITKSQLEQVSQLKVSHVQSPVSPGALKHHYMPDVPMYLSLENESPSELKHLKFNTISLSHKPELAARELYQLMRQASGPGIEAILLVKRKEQVGEHWDGIWNRVSKAITKKL